MKHGLYTERARCSAQTSRALLLFTEDADTSWCLRRVTWVSIFSLPTRSYKHKALGQTGQGTQEAARRASEKGKPSQEEVEKGGSKVLLCRLQGSPEGITPQPPQPQCLPGLGLISVLETADSVIAILETARARSYFCSKDSQLGFIAVLDSGPILWGPETKSVITTAGNSLKPDQR